MTIQHVSDKTEDQYLTPAKVEVGEVAFDDYEAKFSTLGTSIDIFTDYLVQNHYEFDHHRYMLSVTSPGGFQKDKAVFVQLGATTLLWIADWTAEKRGAQPEYPEPWINDPNLVLLDEHYEPTMMELMADGISVIYRLSGTFVYGFKNHKTAKLYYGRPPWMEPTVKMSVSGSRKTNIIYEGKGGTGASSFSSSR